MEWAKPKFSKGQIDRSARVLANRNANADEYAEALMVVNNWRAAHNFPLNTFQVTLRKKTQGVDSTRLVAQRIKRMSSIEAKLVRFPGMRMSQMQDIGGCRAILGTVKSVNTIVERYTTSDLKHKLDDLDNYIERPKESGYRGVHMIYRYYSDREGPSVYNGLYIEMQIRTRLQHTWATAVETVGTFLQQALKSSMGEEQWLRFFSLMGSAFAMKERCDALVPNTPQTEAALAREIKHIERILNVQQVLSMYQQAISVARDGIKKGDHYYLLILEPSLQRMRVIGFKKTQLLEASERYIREEERISQTPGSEAVLVSVDSITSLERAYPNYFLDTKTFLLELSSLVLRG